MPILETWNSRFKLGKFFELIQLISRKVGVQTILTPKSMNFHLECCYSKWF